MDFPFKAAVDIVIKAAASKPISHGSAILLRNSPTSVILAVQQGQSNAWSGP
jgi:hypothetical protein